MGISINDENDIMDLMKKYKENHRVRNAVVIILTDERIIIDPSPKKFKSIEHEEGYGEGFKDGRNDLYNEIHKKYGHSTKKKKNLFD